MKIGFDYIATVGHRGNSVYSRNLIEAIVKLDETNQYYFYAYAHDVWLGRLKQFKNRPNIHVRPVYLHRLGLPVPELVLRVINAVLFYGWSCVDRLDIFHFTNPSFYRKGFLYKAIITIHDLAGLRGVSWTKKSSALFSMRNSESMIAKASKIIAVSQYTKTDILRAFSVAPDKIAVIYEAANSNFYPDNDLRYLQETYGLDSFILYVGQLQPRKNIINLLAAYAQLDEATRKKYPLALVGTARDKEYGAEIQSALQKHDIVRDVKFLGQVDEDSLRKLYSGAKVFVFPSLFEGFGLPVVESLKCGTPVITSNCSSLPEVLGAAGILIDPENVSEMTRAMHTILKDEVVYNDLKRKTLSQAEKFSWDTAAQETIELYARNF